MGATAISIGSSISFDEQWIIVRLNRKLFTPWRWEVVTGLIHRLQQFMAGVNYHHQRWWLLKPSEIPLSEIQRPRIAALHGHWSSNQGHSGNTLNVHADPE